VKRIDAMIPFIDSLNHNQVNPSAHWIIGEESEIEEDPKFIYLKAKEDFK